MASPIGYTSPVNPYEQVPQNPVAPMYHGMQPISPDVPQQMQQQIDKSEAYDSQAAQAAKFQKLLSSGQAGMQAYIQDVGKDNPELAKQFNQEFQSMAQFMPMMKGKELNDAVFNIYDSWNGRYNGAKVGKQIQSNPDAGVRDLLPNSGLDSKSQLSILSQDTSREANAKLAEARSNESAARTTYLTGKPALQVKIAEINAASRERAATLHTNKDKTGFQLSYNDGKKRLDEIRKQIEELKASDPASGGDPDSGKPYPLWQQNMIRENVGWNKAMGDLTKEADKWQRYMDETLSHGARPDQAVDIKNPGMSAPAPSGPPKMGDVIGGYRYKGGDPNDDKNWEPL
jgi:hypothetical protein